MTINLSSILRQELELKQGVLDTPLALISVEMFSKWSIRRLNLRLQSFNKDTYIFCHSSVNIMSAVDYQGKKILHTKQCNSFKDIVKQGRDFFGDKKPPKEYRWLYFITKNPILTVVKYFTSLKKSDLDLFEFNLENSFSIKCTVENTVTLLISREIACKLEIRSEKKREYWAMKQPSIKFIPAFSIPKHGIRFQEGIPRPTPTQILNSNSIPLDIKNQCKALNLIEEKNILIPVYLLPRRFADKCLYLTSAVEQDQSYGYYVSNIWCDQDDLFELGICKNFINKSKKMQKGLRQFKSAIVKDYPVSPVLFRLIEWGVGETGKKTEKIYYNLIKFF